MDGLKMDIDFTWWIELCEKLTPYENFALIGYLVSNNYIPPVAISSETVTEETAKSSSKWLSKNFRKVLYFCCKHYDKKPIILTGTAIDKSEITKSLATALTATYSYPLALGVVIIFAFFGGFLDEWCKKYKELNFKGKGKYAGTFPEGEIESFFDVSYKPAINEIIQETKAKSLIIPKINVVEEAVTEGKAEVPTYSLALSISRNFSEMGHLYSFIDVLSKNGISGHIEFVRLGGFGESTVLVFGSRDLKISN